MANTPKSVTIRTYQVGFGDCFLMSIQYPAAPERHVLIDFGSTALPRDVPRTRLRDVAKNIEKRTGGKLHVVVATHRHQDHLSGFATAKGRNGPGDIIRGLHPSIVVQPWTEDPELALDSTGPRAAGFRGELVKRVAALRTMHEVAERSLKEVQRLATRGPKAISKTIREQLSFLGEDNLKNKSAVKNLMTMGRNVYVYHGSNAGLGRVLPGVKVHVLGPPTLRQTQAIKKQRSADPDEFWHLQASAMRFAGRVDEGETILFPKFIRRLGPPYPIDTRWFIYQAKSMRGDQLLQIVRILDKAMNNTSVILVFEIGNKKLLFPGDAQIENWQFALAQRKNKALLEGVDLYKVGHHGSLNATPKTLWTMFKKREIDTHAPSRLRSLLSTLEGKHGTKDRGTEVPRRKLVAELKSESTLLSTEDMKSSEPFRDVTLTI